VASNGAADFGLSAALSRFSTSFFVPVVPRDRDGWVGSCARQGLTLNAATSASTAIVRKREVMQSLVKYQ
jgi:hypothetical protein